MTKQQAKDILTATGSTVELGKDQTVDPTVFFVRLANGDTDENQIDPQVEATQIAINFFLDHVHS